MNKKFTFINIKRFLYSITLLSKILILIATQDKKVILFYGENRKIINKIFRKILNKMFNTISLDCI